MWPLLACICLTIWFICQGLPLIRLKPTWDEGSVWSSMKNCGTLSADVLFIGYSLLIFFFFWAARSMDDCFSHSYSRKPSVFCMLTSCDWLQCVWPWNGNYLVHLSLYYQISDMRFRWKVVLLYWKTQNCISRKNWSMVTCKVEGVRRLKKRLLKPYDISSQKWWSLLNVEHCHIGLRTTCTVRIMIQCFFVIQCFLVPHCLVGSNL